MSIWINEHSCVGCGQCCDVCPGGLIALHAPAAQGAQVATATAATTVTIATIARPRDCWGCTACVKECPANAIVYFLGADMGGRGTQLQVRSTPKENVWTFTRTDGSTLRIATNKTQANKY